MLELAGDLLGAFNYDDLPEFADWLYGEREALLELRRGALWTLAGRAESAGEYGEAARWAQRLLELDPVSEAAHRALMRFYYLAGDRPAALRAYGRCKEVLAREFGTQPLPETRELARKIDQGMVRAPCRARTERALPAFVPAPARARRAGDRVGQDGAGLGEGADLLPDGRPRCGQNPLGAGVRRQQRTGALSAVSARGAGGALRRGGGPRARASPPLQPSSCPGGSRASCRASCRSCAKTTNPRRCAVKTSACAFSRPISRWCA